MGFIQLATRRSMYDGLRCLEAAGSRLYYWGLEKRARSTFADANNSRPAGFFKDLFVEIYGLCAVKTLKKISFQIQTVQLGCHHHLTLPFALLLGFIP